LECKHGSCGQQDGSCICNAGFVGLTCGEDEYECDTGSHRCSHDCINNYGSYDCTCDVGNEIDENVSRVDCVDIDECSQGIDSCKGLCFNKNGTYECGCNDGFRLDDVYKRECYNINECADNNGGCDHDCLDTYGSYHCQCHHGFLLDPDNNKHCISTTTVPTTTVSLGETDLNWLTNNYMIIISCSVLVFLIIGLVILWKKRKCFESRENDENEIKIGMISHGTSIYSKREIRIESNRNSTNDLLTV
jgi:hypothetical protein